MNYPKEIYVQIEGDIEDQYLIANEQSKDVDDGEVAIYTLSRVANKTTIIEIK